jgi:hypothetical protein
LADSVIGKHFLSIQNLFWMLEQRTGFVTLFSIIAFNQGVTKRCRLFWLTNSPLV